MVEDTSAKARAEGEAPVWARLRRSLMSEIAAWPDPSRRFHSEAEIATRHGVSRVTVRRALAALEADGVLARVRGSGSFVRPLPLTEHLSPSMDVDRGWRALGRAPVARVLACRTLRATAAAAASLGVPRGERLLFIKRVRTVDGLPFAIDERLVPAGIARAAGLDACSASGSIIRLLWRSGPLDVARWTIEARPPSAEECVLLGIGPGQPVLVRHMGYRDPSGRKVLTGHSAHRGDLVRYALSLPLESPTSAEEGSLQAEIATPTHPA